MTLMPQALCEQIKLIDDGQISGTAGKEVFDEMFVSGQSPQDIVKEKG